jgi:hypothetical protein
MVNVHEHRFGAKFVYKLVNALRERLIAGEYDYALNIVSQLLLLFLEKHTPINQILFIADSMNSNLVSMHSLLAFLQSFMTAALQSDIPQVQKILKIKKNQIFSVAPLGLCIACCARLSIVATR